MPSMPSWAINTAWCAAACLTATALAIAVPRLLERTHTAPLPAPLRVVLEGEPAWLPKDERVAIERGIIKTLSSSPFDRDGLTHAREQATRCGWYANVSQVRRSDVDEVIVEGEWAIPFALVCDTSGEHLVDTRGRLLPRTYAAGKGPKLLRILGVSMPCPDSFGLVWKGDEVAAALSMAALLSDRPWRGQVAAIDVASWNADGLLRMRTDKGCEIIWGRAPGKETAAEVPPMQKIAVLQQGFARSGRIDDRAATQLDLRGDFTVTR